MFRYAPTLPRGLRRLVLAAVFVVCLAQLCAVRAQTPPSAPATNANVNANANINSNANANGNANANTNANANNSAVANMNVNADNANGGGTRASGSNTSITSRWFGIEGPAWMVISLVVLLLAFAIVVLKYVPGVRELLGPAADVTRWVILVLVLLVIVFFIGRWFGHTRDTTGGLVPTPAATPSPSPAPTPVTASGAGGGDARAAPATERAAARTAAPTATGQVAQPGATPGATPAPTPTPTPTPYEITVGEVNHFDQPKKPGEPVVAGLGDRILVKVNNLGEEVRRQVLVKEPAASLLDTNRLVLFLDDVEMKELYPEGVDLQRNEVRFKLHRDDEAREAWNTLLAKPDRPLRAIRKVSIGPEGKPAWPTAPGVAQNFVLRVYDSFRLKLNVVLFLVALGLFLWLARRSNIIRDSQPPEPPEGANKPYSLARTQVAWWFFIIFGSFLFLWVVTGDYNVFSTSALVLLGIGTGTALGSAMVDANKHESANNDLRTLKPRQMKLAEEVQNLKDDFAAVEERARTGDATPEDLAEVRTRRAELAAKEAELEQLNLKVGDAESARSKPVSEGFIKDILSDVNGVAFHRFQIVVWTIAFGVVFARWVWNNLQMPEYDDVVLALMGISGATYLGFKIPERQTEPGPQPDATTASTPNPPAPPAQPGGGDVAPGRAAAPDAPAEGGAEAGGEVAEGAVVADEYDPAAVAGAPEGDPGAGEGEREGG